ncbi:FAD binding domain-containing protein [uncultured Sphaerochaeta sp.]|uniref:FAD binding domain-containing protein n=1 Tax=uncultured Sphaerochaeta sp. TaxID=886478 RepID=UPI002A0A5691|nr:FAD binding domain-containing protein [uncultured Sphaerochaeta sp.]
MVNGLVATSLKEALVAMAENTYTPYVGGTDLMVTEREQAEYLFLHKVPEMCLIVKDEQYLRIGASCTFTDVLNNALTPPLLKQAIRELAAPAIRNLGTIGGNIGNGSAKADTALVFFVADALVHVTSIRGGRLVPIKKFYKGRKQLDLAPDELIIEVLLPKELPSSWYYKKIGARKALAISRVAFAALMEVRNEKIISCSVGFGAISEMVIRRPDLDAMLTGKTIKEAKAVKEAYLDAYKAIINPIQGRISAEYRKTVCMNLLADFLEQNGI